MTSRTLEERIHITPPRLTSSPSLVLPTQPSLVLLPAPPTQLTSSPSHTTHFQPLPHNSLPAPPTQLTSSPSHTTHFQPLPHNSLPACLVLSVANVFHAILGEADVETVEESTKKTPHCPHQHKDHQVVHIPQSTLVLQGMWTTCMDMHGHVDDMHGHVDDMQVYRYYDDKEACTCTYMDMHMTHLVEHTKVHKSRTSQETKTC